MDCGIDKYVEQFLIQKSYVLPESPVFSEKDNRRSKGGKYRAWKTYTTQKQVKPLSKPWTQSKLDICIAKLIKKISVVGWFRG